ncbi:hypothetical protein EMIHUDRAFT_103219 [Emiliania huxleyi CCMP1516]|uniref:Uncharacterized protein n=2 Tax=Emiliania huxleyi TaxID=2903 RepID=A0A0D3IWS4_EMIH1|nr:hypothetical protein EMIHUDRAFT_103219 [Emiliania huxleyi CCMP1516]EOD15709.1 hypothetical protein EMIHUDRAFT_103219 [Emiliania huxleyi CCMP1516]|eukprot:XP_005768138.1 hypothetical protein EMIHUDRAFT_103219 [Emiliania huxleyi CCMP1516]
MLTTWLERSPTLAAALQAATGDSVDGEDGSEAEAAEAAAGLALGRAPLVEGGGKGNGVVVSVAATVVDDDASDAGSSGSAAWVDAEAIEVDADEAIGAAGGASELFIAASATPPPPAGWEWPRKGDEIEVDEDGLSTVCRRATVTAVMADGWFQAVARSPSDEAVCHWFTWREEGTDWRRAAPSPLATSAPLSAPRGRLCGNTHERVGGAFGCILPAGHAGPHDYAPRRERRSAKRPLDASATAGPACRRALHLAVVSETALVSMHRRVVPQWEPRAVATEAEAAVGAAVEGAEALRGDDEVEVEVEQESESGVGAEAPSDDDEGCAATSGGSSATHPAPTVATEAEGLQLKFSH